jgi:hypothetical protein
MDEMAIHILRYHNSSLTWPLRKKDLKLIIVRRNIAVSERLLIVCNQLAKFVS